ncbi:MAG: phosphoribosylglycinamide formyltransferase [Chloroflexota bacterium]
MNLAFFASHRGSNMQAVLDACKAGILNAHPCLVIGNNSGAEALARARQDGIPAFHLSVKTHPDPAQLDAATLSLLQEHRTDLIVLAGYLRKLGPQTLAVFQRRAINIHPALLPKYGGQGMYGLRVHEVVLAAGETETGVTIHRVDEAYDHGDILAQCRVPVLAGDTPESLAQRVLACEHRFLVETLQRIVAGDVVL